MAVALGLAFSGASLTGYAAGLGKITVFSALGQPLRAEVEISATREELVDMKAKLASPETFKQAGLDYATTLLSIRFNLEKRPNGKAIIKLSSDRPINDPFVDMLLELNWPTGRLVREYTFLLDPPEYAAKMAAPVDPAKTARAPGDQPGAAATTGTPSTAGAPTATAAGTPTARPSASSASRIDGEVRNRALNRILTQEIEGQQSVGAATPETKSVPGAAAGSYTVKGGDTLGRIAGRLKPDGVSLDQMLVGLLRANPDAFDGGNMNRLKANRTLSMPDKAALEAVSSGEARKVVLAQAADWNAYRNRLAGIAEKSTATETEGARATTGTITAKVDDNQGQAEAPKDQLRVAKTDVVSGKGGAGGGKGSEEDLIAKEKALQEANERVASLNKIVSDMEKLLALRDQQLAEMQQAAQSGSTTPVQPPSETPPTSTPVEPVPPASATPPGADTQPPPVVVPTEPVAPPPVVSPPPEQRPPEPPRTLPQPPQEEPPSFFEELLGDYMVLGGLGSIVALIAAYFLVRRYRAGKEAEDQELMTSMMSSTLAPLSKTSLMANSVFRNTGGQSVDTSAEVSVPHTDFSQAGPGSIDTDEVDPVAEADVYMAYGRDAQAEEILLEAHQKDPKRTAIMLKLLEIYSGRSDLKTFETLATELYSETSGIGSDWEQAAAMGAKLDPRNMLFRSPSSTDPVGVAPLNQPPHSRPVEAAPPVARMKAVEVVPEVVSDFIGQVQKPVSVAPQAPKPKRSSIEKAAEMADLDFELGIGKQGADHKPSLVVQAGAVADGTDSDIDGLDFDLEVPEVHVKTPSRAEVPPVVEKQPASPKSVDVDIKPKAQEPSPEAMMRSASVAPSPSVAGRDAGKAVPEVAPTVARNAPEKPSAVPPGGSSKTGDFSPSQSPDVEFDMSLTESTFLDRFEPEMQSFDLASIDLDLQLPEIEMSATKAQPETLTSHTLPPSEEEARDRAFEKAQSSTVVNPNAAVQQIETLLVPEHSHQTQLETLLVSESRAQETVLAPDSMRNHTNTIVDPMLESATELDTSMLEEAVTKLELAKAYEEMGDLEGARELLQEVVKEGDASQREAAQSLLARIGK